MNSDKKKVWKKTAVAYSISTCQLLESRDSVTIMRGWTLFYSFPVYNYIHLIA